MNLLLTEEFMALTVIDVEGLNDHPRGQIEYHYMFWACQRGNPFIVNYILK